MGEKEENGRSKEPVNFQAYFEGIQFAKARKVYTICTLREPVFFIAEIFYFEIQFAKAEILFYAITCVLAKRVKVIILRLLYIHCIWYSYVLWLDIEDVRVKY